MHETAHHRGSAEAHACPNCKIAITTTILCVREVLVDIAERRQTRNQPPVDLMRRRVDIATDIGMRRIDVRVTSVTGLDFKSLAFWGS